MAQLKLDHSRGDTIGSKYEVVDPLDRSPLGQSYRVKHLSSGKYVRLVMLDPTIAGREQKDQIIAAVKVAREAKHRNLLRVGELAQHEGVAFVTMEDFDGRTLREVLLERKAEGRPFELREAAQITMQILEATEALHKAGHVFRALRPEYVQVELKRTGPRGQNVVADVRVIGAGLWNLVPSGSLAEDEFTRGEAQYLAPELKGVDPQPTSRSDIYSVGTMLYELLTGIAPVGTYQLPRQRRPDLPEHIDTICELALSMSPEDRYPTARDFITDIQRTFSAHMNDAGGPDRPAGVAPMVWGLALALIGVFALLLFRTGADPYEVAVAEDALQRRTLLDEHPKPTTDEIRAVLARHPPNMMFIPEGPYLSGKLRQEIDVSEPESVAEVKQLPGFLIDVFEYPNLKGAPPKNGASYADAERLCAEAGKRLCSADEFEKACRGPQNYVYGYGDTYDVEFCGAGIDDVHLSGALPECKSGWGVYDIAGNLREWTSSKRGDSRRIVKGGLPQSAARGTRCAFGTDLSVAFSDASIAFRCCRDLDAPTYEPPAEDTP